MSDASNRLLLKHHLEKLRLPTMRRDWEQVAASCAKEGCDHVKYLWRLCECELIEREQRAAARRVKNAKFPVPKTLDSFEFDAQPTINETLVRQLATCQYLKEHDNVLLIGNSGTGKSPPSHRLGIRRLCSWQARAFLDGVCVSHASARIARTT